MGPEICAFPGTAYHCKERSSGHKRQNPQVAFIAPVATTEHGQHSDNSKNRCGESHKEVVAAMEEHIYIVGRCGCEEHTEEAQAIAGKAAEEVEQKTAKEAVAQEMNHIGMEAEGCEQTVVLMLDKDSLGISCTVLEPDGLSGPGPGYRVEKDHAANEEQSGWLQEGAKAISVLSGPWWPVLVFGEVRLKLTACLKGIFVCNPEDEIFCGFGAAVANPLGRKGEGAGQGLLLIVRFKDSTLIGLKFWGIEILCSSAVRCGIIK